MKIFVNGFSAIFSDGYFSSSKEFTKFSDTETPLSIGRKAVYQKLHTGFGKLNPPDKMAFSVASLILDQNEISESTGISLATTFGSFSTDLRYLESIADGFPSPAYFQATLPSSALAEVAIMFKLKGPNRVFVGKSTAFIEGLRSSIQLIRNQKTDSMLFIFVNAIDQIDNKNFFLPKRTNKNSLEKENSAFALLLSNKRIKATSPSINLNFNYKKGEILDSEVSFLLELTTALKDNINFNKNFSSNGVNFNTDIIF